MTETQYEFAYQLMRIEYAHAHGIYEITTGSASRRPPGEMLEGWRSKLHVLGVLDEVEEMVRADAESERRPYVPYLDDFEAILEEHHRANGDDVHCALLDFPGAYEPFEQPRWDELDDGERRVYLTFARGLTIMKGIHHVQFVQENRIAELAETFHAPNDRTSLLAAVEAGASALHVHARILLAGRPEVTIRQILRVYGEANPDVQELIVRCVDLQNAESALRSRALREQLRGFTRVRLLAAADTEEFLERMEQEWTSESELRAFLKAVSILPPERASASPVPDLPRYAASPEACARAFESDEDSLRFRAYERGRLSQIPGSGRATSNIEALLVARKASDQKRMCLPFLTQTADAVFTDVDGTLIDTYDDCDGLALRRLRLLASAGVPVAIVTGRDCADVQRILQSAGAFPGLRIYGRNGMDVAESDGSAWRPVEPVVDLAAMRTPERVRAYAELAVAVDAIIKSDAPLLKRTKRREAFLSLSITTSYRDSARELPPPPEAIDGLLAALDAKLVIPDGFQLWNCGEALQITPTELGKRACLVHFARTRTLDPDRILRVGDQGQSGHPHLVPGNDAEILDHAMGISVLHAGSSGRRAPHTRGAGLAWILDNAIYRLNPPPFLPPHSMQELTTDSSIETSAFGMSDTEALETSAFPGYTASGYSMKEDIVEQELVALFASDAEVDGPVN